MMKFYKRLFSIALLFVAFSINIYAIEYAIGAGFVGIGPTFVRGDNYKRFFGEKENHLKLPYNLSYSTAVEATAHIGIFKHFGFDFGIGYGIKSYGYSDYEIYYVHKFHYISAPILLRTEVEFFERLNLYLLAGVRYNFNILAYSNVYVYDIKDETLSANMEPYLYNVFTMDVSFSLGIEYRISGGHYIGIRAGYNMNVLSYFKLEDGEFNGGYLYKNDDIYMDNMSFSLTYKYSFNKKYSPKKDNSNTNGQALSIR